MPSRRITWLDVFTSTPLTGNGLAVVHDADGLDDETMLRFARETRLSETTFVQSPTETRADYRNRIFMPTGEVPFAGHPSLGTAVAFAHACGQERATYRQETLAGVQAIEVAISGDRATVSMIQEPAVFAEEVEPEVAFGAIGLGADAGVPEVPPQFVATGVPQLIVCLADPESLSRIVPDYDAIGRLLIPRGALTLYAAHVEGEAGSARAFAESALVGEDPATGSAVSPLMALMHDRFGVERLSVEQGVQMGRPSLLRAWIEDGRVHVGGEVVVLFDGRIRLDG